MPLILHIYDVADFFYDPIELLSQLDEEIHQAVIRHGESVMTSDTHERTDRTEAVKTKTKS